jgi:glycosyl transferase, family 25
LAEGTRPGAGHAPGHADLSPPPDTLMENFVINLARKPQKFDNFLKLNAESGIAFKRYEACDGAAVSEAEAVKMMIVTPGTKLTKGAIGCAISHFRVWQQCIEKGEPILVFEDDAVLRNDFSEAFPKLLAGLRRWDYLNFGYNTDSILDIEIANGMRSALTFEPKYPGDKALKDFARSANASAAYRLNNCFGTCGYAISPAGAKRLSKLCFPMTNRTVTITALQRSISAFGLDCMLNDAYPKVDAYAAFSPLVVPKNDRTTSTTIKE